MLLPKKKRKKERKKPHTKRSKERALEVVGSTGVVLPSSLLFSCESCLTLCDPCLTLCDLWTAAHQASLSFTISQSLFKFMSIESVMSSNHLILCHPFSSCSKSFPESGSFPLSQLFTSGGQSIGALASVLPVNIQD